MRVAILNWRDSRHPQAGGAEVVVHQQATGLAKRGHDVTLYSSRFPSGLAEDTGDGYRICRSGTKFTVYPSVAQIVKRTVRTGQTDVILEHINGISFFSPLWARVPTVGYLYHVVGRTFFEELPFPASLLGYAIERSLPVVFRHTQCLVLGSAARAQFEGFGFKRENLEVVSPGVDQATYHPGKKSDVPTIVCLGPIKQYKRHDVVLLAFSKVIKSVPEARLIITGWDRGNRLSSLQALAARLGVQKSVDFTGYVDEATKARILRESWCLVYASEREGWGLGVAEAASSGTPTVATRIGGLRDTVIDGRTGMLYDVGRYDVLGRILIDFLLSARKLKEYSEASLALSGRFSWTHHLDLVELALSRVLKKG